MTDSTNRFPWPDTNMTHESFRGRPATVSGTTQQAFESCPLEIAYKGIHTNTSMYPIDYGAAHTAHLATGLSDDYQDYINDALSKNSPGAPKVDMAAFIYELRELPGTLFDLAARSGWLSKPIAWTFGIKPVLSDISSAISLAKSIDERQRMLRSMVNQVRKEKMNLAFRKVSDTNTGIGSLNYTGFLYKTSKVTSQRVWCTKHHTIGVNPKIPPPMFDSDYCLGLLTSDTSVATFWELFPWSWLVDYFVGIGTMIDAAGGNRIPGYQVLDLNIMIETKTRCDYLEDGRVDRWTGGTFRPGYYERKSQLRRVVKNPSPTFPRVLGYLTSGHQSILAQLAASMASKR